MDLDKTLEAQWVYDSATGKEVLVILETNEVVARRDRGGMTEWVNAY